jgi:3-oxoacyl-[acyl-carrier protein] reductase
MFAIAKHGYVAPFVHPQMRSIVMDLCLNQKVAVVTGGSRGIGKEAAIRLAEEGATVLFTYAHSSEAADNIVDACSERGLNLHAYKVDVKDRLGVNDFFEMIEKEFGTLDILINNAGIIRDNLLMAMSGDEWDDVIATNLTGIFNTIRPATRMMMRKRTGSIVNLSSIAASRPGRGHANYAASKGGVEAMTKALAVELAPRNIRVNCIAPGMIETDMSQQVRDLAGDEILGRIPLKRYGQVTDICNAIMCLVSDVSSYVTGEVIHVDGGVGV